MDIKELRKTPAYQELRNYVNKHVPEAQRPYQLGQLAKRFLARFDHEFYDHELAAEVRIVVSFSWQDTPEGHDWWWGIKECRDVGNLNPCPIHEKGVPKIAKIAPKKRVGWWVG